MRQRAKYAAIAYSHKTDMPILRIETLLADIDRSRRFSGEGGSL